MASIASNLSGPAPHRRGALLALAALCACTAVLLFAAAPASAAEACPNELFRTGLSAALPDCRAYEMVSPPYKQGTPVVGESIALSRDGTRVMGIAVGAFAGTENSVIGVAFGAYYELRREAGGWGAHALDPPASYFGVRRLDASADLTESLWLLHSISRPEHVTELFLRGPDGAFTQVGPANPGFTPATEEPTSSFGQVISYLGASADLTHLLVRAEVTSSFHLWPGDTTEEGKPSLYEYTGTGNTEPTLVGISNDGRLDGQAYVNEGAQLISECGTLLGGIHEEPQEEDKYNAISASGKTVFFTALHRNSCTLAQPPVNELYARIGGEQTVAISEPPLETPGRNCTALCEEDQIAEEGKKRSPATFEGASQDGSEVFFRTAQPLLNEDEDETPDLYEVQLQAGAVKSIALVSAGGEGDPSPGQGAEVLGVARLSEDGSHVYFVAKGVLTGPNPEGKSPSQGAPNLYAYDTETLHTSFIATLSEAADTQVWSGGSGGDFGSVQATPDGRFLLFQSAARLTPDDRSGEAAPQLFRYDAQAEALTRVSIGQRGGYLCPATEGVEEGFNCDGNTDQYPPMVTKLRYGGADRASEAASSLALSNDGAVVTFESSNSLTPQALPGVQNVYEYRGGNVYLITSGQGPAAPGSPVEEGSGGGPGGSLLGIDGSGQDVFFESEDPLLPQDTDTTGDFYDARQGGGFPAPSAPAPCEAEACQGPLGSTPPAFPPGSAAFQGPANPKHVRKPKKRHGKHHKRAANNNRRASRWTTPRALPIASGSDHRHRSSRIAAPLAAAPLGALALAPNALAAAAPGWEVQSVAAPSNFSQAADNPLCSHGPEPARCDEYELLISNVGALPSEGLLTIVDTLPPGTALASTAGIETEVFSETETRAEWQQAKEEGEEEGNPTVKCEEPEPAHVTCTYGRKGESLPPGGELSVRLPVDVTTAEPATATNRVTVEGGGGATVSSAEPGTVPNTLNGARAGFGTQDLHFSAYDSSGRLDTQAADHPAQVTMGFDLSSVFDPGYSAGESGAPGTFPAHEAKDILIDLPLGFAGDPQAAATCAESAVIVGLELEFEFGRTNTQCPAASRLGNATISLSPPVIGYSSTYRKFGQTTALYSLAPEGGFPAGFGFSFFNTAAPAFASLVPSPAGYRLQVAIPGIMRGTGVKGVSVTLFGDPNTYNESGNGPAAFFTNPSACGEEPLTATVKADSWEEPGKWASKVVTAYPKIDGCEALQFHPSLELRPEETQADTPTGLAVDLHVPQSPDHAPNLATPDLKDATVTLPQGLAVSASQADGLAGCPATGPTGINLPSAKFAPGGADEGNPEATELGAGHPGGNASPYDDGLYHSAPGHCPAASTLGTVEVKTPLLPEPIHGHVYLGTPDCSPCSEADAREGRMVKLYIEVAGQGVIAKLPGSASIDPATGRLTASFKQNPQLPFEDFKLHFKSGPRAALATPAICGHYTTETDLRPWSAPQTPDATPQSSFEVTSGPNGTPCASPLPFKPSAEGGSLVPLAGAHSPFSLTINREDGNQRLSRVNATLPPGETAKLKGVGECSEAALAQAAAKSAAAEQASPSCPASSLIGTATVGAGPGSHPFHVAGKVYLTGPYKGAPLGLAFITPAAAGPFDLGTVVVRAAAFVDPETARIHVASDPLPQMLDGIPLDIRSVVVSTDRPNFSLNPTSCNPLSVGTELFSAEGATAALSNPFQVGGCSGLPFKPKLKISLKGATKRTGHPALTATLTAKPGEANIARAAVTLPHSEFLDNAHIRTVCTRVQFAADQCPAASIYGHATAITPLLDQPLSGPVYLRSSSHKLPDLVAALNGQINVDLDGRIDTGKGGGIRNTFSVVPDAPVTKFTLSMQGGSKGLLVNSENLCSPKAKTHAAVNLTGQNGKVYDTTPAVGNSCGSKKHKVHAKSGAHR